MMSGVSLIASASDGDVENRPPGIHQLKGAPCEILAALQKDGEEGPRGANRSCHRDAAMAAELAQKPAARMGKAKARRLRVLVQQGRRTSAAAAEACGTPLVGRPAPLDLSEAFEDFADGQKVWECATCGSRSVSECTDPRTPHHPPAVCDECLVKAALCRALTRPHSASFLSRNKLFAHIKSAGHEVPLKEDKHSRRRSARK